MNETVLLDAELKPNPPMKPACLFFALVILTATNFAFALGFVLRSAWPIAPFMGADIGFLAWAFRTSVVAARQREWITLTPASLRIRRVPSRGKAEEIALNPYWVRVRMDDPPEPRSQLILSSHGRSVRIGSFLAPADRLSFARTLRKALARARQVLPAQTGLGR